MALLKITQDQYILRKISKPVTDFDERLWRLLDDMRDTLTDANGLGLAAVQVGVLYRVCLVATPDEIVELINPIIFGYSNHKTREEGCLSIPNVYGEVYRPHKVKVRFQDRHGNTQNRIFEKICAACVVHEIDHMNGILFTDHLKKNINS